MYSKLWKHGFHCPRFKFSSVLTENYVFLPMGGTVTKKYVPTNGCRFNYESGDLLYPILGFILGKVPLHAV